MEETTEINTPSKPHPNLIAGTIGRALLTVASLIVGILSSLLATFYAIVAALNIPIALHHSLVSPFQAFFSTIAHLLSILIILALSISLFTIAYRLIKRRSLTRWHSITCFILLILTIILLHNVTPILPNFSAISPAFFTQLITF